MSTLSIDAYITRLLYDNDCVIVPALGAFVIENKEAAVDSKTMQILPRRRVLSFNRNMTLDDGVLKNHIANSAGISVAKASQLIENNVRELQNLLGQGKSVAWPSLGNFKKDGTMLIFNPRHTVNFDKSSFGLRQVSFSGSGSANSQKSTDARGNGASEKKSKKLAITAGVAGVVVALLLLGVVFLRPQVMNDITHYGKSAFFQTKAFIVKLTSRKTSTNIPVLQDTVATTVPDTTEIEPAITLPVDTVRRPQKVQYGIVAGSFKDHTNAEKLVELLIKDGYDASILGTIKGLEAVGYGVYPSRSAANKALDDIIFHEEYEADVLPLDTLP